MDFSGSFVDKSGRILQIRRLDDPKMPFRIQITLPAELDHLLQTHRDYPFEIRDELKGWIDQDEQDGEFLKVEAGILGHAGAGPTLDLFPISADQFRPRVSMGLYDDWEDDLGLPWAFPLSVYHRQI
jgi:hypothetical protein